MRAGWIWVAAASAVMIGATLAQSAEPKVLEHDPPVYPPAEEAARHGGRVVVRVNVSEAGLAESVAVDTSSGFPALDQAVVDAAKTWRFVPATDDVGKAVAGSAKFALMFTPPIRKLDMKKTCAETTQEVASLRAQDPDARLDQIPSLGALMDLAERMDAGMAAYTGGVAVGEMPELYAELLARCEKEPKTKMLSVYFAITKANRARNK
jgi:TonB family protein